MLDLHKKLSSDELKNKRKKMQIKDFILCCCKQKQNKDKNVTGYIMTA